MLVPLSFDESEPSSPLSPHQPVVTEQAIFTSATDTHVNNNARLRKPQPNAQLLPSTLVTQEQQQHASPSNPKPRSMPRNHQGGLYERLESGNGNGAGGWGGRSFFSAFFGRRSGTGGNGGGWGNGSHGAAGVAARGGADKVRFTWKRLAIGAVVFIVLVWVFGPRIKGGVVEKVAGGGWVGAGGGNETYPGTPYDSELDPPENFPAGTGAGTGTGTGTDTAATAHPTSGGVWYPDIDADLSNPSSNSKTHPTSYKTDPDPSSTTYCKTSFDAFLPLVQYALMIDAGSTGSRIHVYKFNHCKSTVSFEYEVFKMTQPGLSAYAGKPDDAAKSLDVLLEEAVRVVPEKLRSCTPVAVKATAGLRLLPGTQSTEILSAVEKRLKEAYPFQLPEKDGVVLMDGKDEGVYAWITVNYLMGTINEGVKSGEPTYAVLDLGGASTQIVFEPLFENDEGEMEEGEHKYDLKFAGRNHVLYQHSYLGYGLMRARMHVHRLVDFMDAIRAGRRIGNGNEDGSADVVGNPCLAKGTRRTVEITDEKTGEKRNVTMGGEDVGSFDGCNRLMQLVLAKDAICELKPCSFDGVYQPSLLTSFPSGKVLLLSYFYDRLTPLLPPTSPFPTTVHTLANISRSVCEGRETWLNLWGAKPDVMKELQDRPEWCLDLTFMYSLLRLGYEFDDEREVKLGKKIRGTELGWCLGATIAMVGGGELKCRA